MDVPRPFHMVESAAADARLAAAASFLRQFPATHPINIVAATRGAADDLARTVALGRGATIGLARYSLTQLAARVASARLAGEGVAPATALGTEAVAARVSFEAARARSLSYFAEVAATPGFPRALARTIAELRVAGIAARAVADTGEAGADLALLLDRAERELLNSESADRARLLTVAAEAAAADPSLRAPLLLLDVPIESAAEERFVRALIAAAREVCATVPTRDETARQALERAGGASATARVAGFAGANVRTPADPDLCTDESTEPGRRTDLDYLRAYLFADSAPPERALDGSLQFFSAPGEGRECVEIARRVLQDAARGVRFDEMAILVRAPQQYHGLLEHALERGGIPAWFDRGTRRPHPAGRAFLALLACAAEGLSARRFAEYLSLGQLPEGEDGGKAVPGVSGYRTQATSGGPEGPPLRTAGRTAHGDLKGPRRTDAVFAASTDEVFGRARVEGPDDDAVEEAAWDGSEHDEDQPAVAGTLRTPRHWERMLVEASVVGGAPARWRRRLDGLGYELTARLDGLRLKEPGSPRAQGIERDLHRLAHLRDFALPLVDEMAAWPSSAPWGVWLERLERLAPRVLRVPAYVLRVLADLKPMATIGPTTIDEVRSVLADRLLLVDAEPPARRYGRVFVSTPAQVRGRAFRVVFVPGLAERMFPQKPRQDPLLLDAARHRVDGALHTQAERRRLERLLLHLAVGAATERLYVSYPRIEVAEARARVPSFYALDVLRGATGRIPDHETLAEGAAQAGDPTLAWPAPADPARAIDDQEHDLAVLRGLLDARDPAAVRGHAQYMLRLNPALRRSVTERWARGQRKWSQFDGLTRATDRTSVPLAIYRLVARPYSVSALQRFSVCPYQFLLGAMYRLEPAEPPQPLQRLDPLTRGSIFHRMQAVFFRELARRGALPVTRESLELALTVLAEVVDRVAAAYREQLAPAVDRVWRDEIGAMARDLRGWLRRVAEDGESWTPRYFELAFGLTEGEEQRDPASVPEPVPISERFTLRGSVDLVEEHRQGGALRVTDHKTGRNRSAPGMVIGGGAVLQPMLYAIAVERITGKPVAESRLSFCTAAGGFSEKVIPFTPANRRLGLEALEIIDRAIELGFLPQAPLEGACAWCDFRPVCGPNEEERVARKPPDRLRDLHELRSRP